jgi:hypothetical protein
MPFAHAANSMDGRPKRWIQEVVESPKFHKGAFTAKAERHGMTTVEMMKKVLGHPDEYDIHTRRQAQFMKNAEHHHLK